MQRIADVLIIGGGVIGLTTACELARAGRRVLVCDRGKLGREASWAAAGIIPPGTPRRGNAPFQQLRAVGSVLFAELSNKLMLESGIDTGYRECGGIEFAERADDRKLLDTWKSDGVEVEPLDRTQIKNLEPNVLPQAAPAVHLPGMAQVRPPRHLRALILAAQRLGVVLSPDCRVSGYSVQGRRVNTVDTKEGPVIAGQYVICAGAWSRRVAGALRYALPLFPVRGQMLLLKLPGPIFQRVLLQGKRYLVPRDDGRVLVGSTEEDVGFDQKTVQADLDDLRDFALRLVPQLASAEIESSWAGLRPGTPDAMPLIGPLPELDNVWVATGHFRSGIHLSAVTARVVSQALSGEEPIVPIDAFRLDRQIVTCED
jgi:glycine oxidase